MSTFHTTVHKFNCVDHYHDGDGDKVQVRVCGRIEEGSELITDLVLSYGNHDQNKITLDELLMLHHLIGEFLEEIKNLKNEQVPLS
jgi:hypothetical protein